MENNNNKNRKNDKSTGSGPIKLRKKGLGTVRTDQPYPSVKQYASNKDLEEFDSRIQSFLQHLETTDQSMDNQQQKPK